MSARPVRPAEEADDPRRQRLLESALVVFMRFGFRKASMDEIARAAQVSRQGLYLHFSTKEELFVAALTHTVGQSLGAAERALADTSLPMDERLIRAFDEWTGRYIGMLGAGASDLAEVTRDLGGDLVTETETRFIDAVTKALKSSPGMADYKRAGITPRQLAETLHATGRGLKYASPSREVFVQKMTIAVKALCLVLGGNA
ncbi:MAG: TetR/AcrR family transcriptional regulator [Polyangiaceae bacterium]|nr:TetR/AcrR family transcriptional regulator [Polyangiaceae bacterium]